MEKIKPIKGIGYVQQIAFTILVDAILLTLGYFATTYELLIIIRLVFIVFNLFQIYYILLYFTLNYSFDENNLYIVGNWGLKKVVIPFNTVEKYFIKSGTIRGRKISGHASKSFALGKAVLDKHGATYMFVTSNKQIIYLKTEGGNFAISPSEISKFEEKFISKNLIMAQWKRSVNKYSGINKEKKFIILLVIASIITITLTANPYILYKSGKLHSARMPLSFDGNFVPVKYGTVRQFVFKQMSYGVLNMAVLFCMYYAAFFRAKYDKKTAYAFIIFSIILSSVFLIIQLKILYHYR